MLKISVVLDFDIFSLFSRPVMPSQDQTYSCQMAVHDVVIPRIIATFKSVMVGQVSSPS